MSGPVWLFAPGAGAGSDSPWMAAWTARLRRIGPVVPFDYDYRLAGRRAPDRLPRLIERHRAALAAAGDAILVGKSMGGRVACHVAALDPVRGVVVFGYPLRAPSGASRADALAAVPCPLLLVQGTRDPLAPLDALQDAIAARSAPTTLHVVQGGDHSLLLPAARARDGGQAASDDEVCAVIAHWAADRDLAR